MEGSSKKILSYPLLSRSLPAGVLAILILAQLALAQGNSDAPRGGSGSSPPAVGGPPGKPPSDIEFVERLMRPGMTI